MNWLVSIHVAKAKAGLDDDRYRALLMGACGVSSSRDVKTWRQYDAIRSAFAALGVQMPSRPAPSNPPLMRKAYALWCQLARDGKVGDKSWAAMAAFQRRQFHGQDILTRSQQAHLVEILKRWLGRED